MKGKVVGGAKVKDKMGGREQKAVGGEGGVLIIFYFHTGYFSGWLTWMIINSNVETIFIEDRLNVDNRS